VIRAAALVCVFAATATAKPAPGSVAVIDRVVAIVDREPIWQSDLDARVALSGGAVKPAEALDQMIDDALWLARAREVQVTVEDGEIDAALAEIKQQNGISDAQLDELLAKSSFTRARYRLELGRQLIMLKIANLELRTKVTVGDDEIKAIDKDPAHHDAVQRELVAKKLDVARADWLRARRTVVRIEKRP
jgi:parvulin-like peptidyl-prolyl isomerase